MFGFIKHQTPVWYWFIASFRANIKAVANLLFQVYMKQNWSVKKQVLFTYLFFDIKVSYGLAVGC